VARTEPPPSSNERKHESTNPIQRALVDRFVGRVVEIVERLAPASTLDVGCGEGYVLDALRRRGVGGELHGVDLSAQAIERARARLGDGVSLRQADATTLGEEGRRFDLVMSLEVLEHIPGPEQVLPVLHRLAGRNAVLSVPHEPWFRGLNLARGRHLRRLGNHPEHVNLWTRHGFMEFIDPWFQPLERVGAFPWTLVMASPRPLVPVATVEDAPPAPGAG
jgi:SAM-dependent methyltransferase